MSLVYWDSMLFIYWLEDNPAYADRIGVILDGMESRGDILCTSAFTLGEVLAGPLKRNDVEVARRAKEAMRDPWVRLLPFDGETAERFAQIRAAHSVSRTDAIHLAAAGQAKADLFLTNDAELKGKQIPGIQFIAGIDVNLY